VPVSLQAKELFGDGAGLGLFLVETAGGFAARRWQDEVIRGLLVGLV
jgi:hypothetical protein